MPKVIVTNTDTEDEDSSPEQKVQDNENEEHQASSGLGEFMAKVLSSASGKAMPILAKAETDKEKVERIKKRKQAQLLQKKSENVDTSSDGNVVNFGTAPAPKHKKIDSDSDDDKISLTSKEYKEKMIKKKQWEEMCHVVPPFSKEDIEKSRKLKRIGTRGVVKLFNSVLQHQEMMSKKVQKDGTTESKREKILKSVSNGQFLDSLKDMPSNDDLNNSIKVEIKEEPKDDEEMWDALRDDYMLDSSMKDWNKNKSSDSEMEVSRNDDSDSD